MRYKFMDPLVLCERKTPKIIAEVNVISYSLKLFLKLFPNICTFFYKVAASILFIILLFLFASPTLFPLMYVLYTLIIQCTHFTALCHQCCLELM